LAPGEDYLESKRTIEAIQLLLKQANVRSGNAIVCIGRSNVELRSVHLPSVDKNELPEMVRFAAQRHFANVGDSWPIDFVTLGTTAEGMTEVLAASMNPSRIERISKLLEANGLKLGQLVLRPMLLPFKNDRSWRTHLHSSSIYWLKRPTWQSSMAST
jgi:Tfp pilus assembly PilM family ATPase